jgi:hypothetical protein
MEVLVCQFICGTASGDHLDRGRASVKRDLTCERKNPLRFAFSGASASSFYTGVDAQPVAVLCAVRRLAAIRSACLAGGKGPMLDDEVKSLLYDAILELSYVQEFEDGWPREMIASAKGKQIVERGMKLLGIKDLSAENWKAVKRK